jgi:hypothetical protein
VFDGAPRAADQGTRAHDDIPSSGGAQSSPGPSAALDPAAATAHAPSKRRVLSIGQLAAIAGVLIAFFFAIDMLASSHVMWFQWPSLVIIVLFTLRIIWVWRR